MARKSKKPKEPVEVGSLFSREFGSILKRKREALGLSQVELALAFGASPVTISGVETGKTVPSFERGFKLCKILQINMDHLMKFVDAEAEQELLAEVLADGAQDIDSQLEILQQQMEMLKQRKLLNSRIKNGTPTVPLTAGGTQTLRKVGAVAARA